MGLEFQTHPAQPGLECRYLPGKNFSQIAPVGLIGGAQSREVGDTVIDHRLRLGNRLPPSRWEASVEQVLDLARDRLPHAAPFLNSIRFVRNRHILRIQAIEEQHAPAVDREQLPRYSALFVARFHLAEAWPASVTSDFCAAYVQVIPV